MKNLVKVEGVALDATIGERKIIGKWTCDPKVRNHLYLNNVALRGRSISFDFDQISWSAGAGWPYYDIPVPREEKYARDYLPRLNRHCIVLEMTGNYFEPRFLNGNSFSINKSGDVIFYVNDDDYRDNTGSFTVVITDITP
jgi:hypothetical protein